jgi:DNA-binding response OmpR family regulator
MPISRASGRHPTVEDANDGHRTPTPLRSVLRPTSIRVCQPPEGVFVLRVLVVEDEPTISGPVRVALSADGHAVDVAEDGLEALVWAESYPYDLLILDVVLPGLDGFGICRRLRERGLTVPILLLTALDKVQDRVTGLDRGADDYLVKPFAMAELRARVRALARRQTQGRLPTIKVHDLELDPATHAVRRGDRTIALSVREFAMLELFARHPGHLFHRDRLIDKLWNADYSPESNIVEVYVRNLRRKIDGGRRDGLIETVRGSGYRLRTEPPTSG